MASPATPSRVHQSPGQVRRLRTKTGCLTCRDRRKKCDERWPICSGCDRNLLTCCWRRGVTSPHSGSGQHRSTSVTQRPPKNQTTGFSDKEDNSAVESATNSAASLPNLLPLTTVTARSPALRNTTDHNLFAYCIDKLLPLMARPYVHPEYKRFPYHLTIALHQPIVMDVLLASAAMHLSEGNPHRELQAFKYYSSAIHMLLQKIAGREVDGTEDWVLLVAMILCLFEVSPFWRVSDSSCVDLPDTLISVGIRLAKPEPAHTS